MKNVTVLAVDDDEAQLQIFSAAFERAGYRYIMATSGTEALGYLEREPIGVVVADLGMPGMSGLELLRHVRARDPELPILVVTGTHAVSSAIESIDAGVFRFMTKPVSAPELVKAVGDAVNARALAQARRAAYTHLASGETHAPSPRGLLLALQTLWMAVQPIVAPAEQRVVAYEALLRTHDEMLRDPSKVLSAAERLNMLSSVGRAVRTLCATLATSLPPDTDLFINVHPRDLLDDLMLSQSDPLFAHANRVVLEVTERASLGDIPDARARVQTLKAMGYRIALDDMGAGYAGLTTFAMLEPDFVKIDPTLVRQVDTDPMKQTLIRTLVGLARELRIEVIAEGVETPQERDALTALGCNRLQGYLFARPGPAFPLVSW